MKNLLSVLLFLVSIVVFGQVSQKHDYFVQFNGSQFANKVAIADIFKHKVFDSFKKSDFDIDEYTKFIEFNENITVHGNFTDSLPYYQITFPIKSSAEVTAFIENKIASKVAKDSIIREINTEENYKLYSDSSEKYSIAWNENNLVIVEFLKPMLANYEPVVYDYENEETYEEEYEEEVEAVEAEETEEELQEKINSIPPPPPAPEVISVEEWNENEEEVVEESEEEWEDDYDYEEENKEYYAQLEVEKQERIVKQNEYIATLFENTFIAPTSDKITKDADVSIWINYGSTYSAIYNTLGYSKYLSGLSSKGFSNSMETAIKGLNYDFYFKNDKASVIQSVEYSNSLAAIMKRIVNRKINNKVFNYFPKTTPLGFASYHISSEEMLKGFPEISEQVYGSMFSIDNKDISVVTDLIATILDEKAIATMFDGDLSMFLHDVQEKETIYTTYEYDEDYEEIEVEKTVKKQLPIFSFVFTSTHPTLGDKLIDLGVRKNGLEENNGVYLIKGTSEMGGLQLIKDGSVIVITNGLEYLNNNRTSDYSNSIKKQLKKNYLYGHLNLKQLIKSSITEDTKDADKTKMLKVAEEFQNVNFSSSKKIVKNKLFFEMNVESSKNDKNIILQTLDLIDFLK